MRIGVNCFLLGPRIGGLRNYFHTLFDYLLEFDSENTYVFFHFAQNASELETLRSDRWRANTIRLESQEQIASHWKAIDLHFCPFGAIWPRPAPIPSVFTLVDIQEVFFPEFFDIRQQFERQFHYRSSTKAADRVITISEYSKRTIVEHHRTSADRVKVAHLAADPIYYRASELGRPLAESSLFERFVFFPANRWFHKNHDLLLRALRLLKQDKALTVHAIFTGFDVDGGYQLFEKAAEYGVSDQVRSVGYVSIEEMAFLYTRAEMLVFPSLFEGFGLPLVEAMAAGCPCVVSDATSLPEIAGDSALYFDPHSVEQLADAIARLLQDSALRVSLVDKGRKQASLFSPERMAAAHLEAFHEAVASFSRLRYWWQAKVHQPLHSWRVHRRFRGRL